MRKSRRKWPTLGIAFVVVSSVLAYAQQRTYDYDETGHLKQIRVLDLAERELVELNQRFGAEEQSGAKSRSFFERYLSDHLVFRRATGKVVGKFGDEGFVDGLSKPSPFVKRRSEDISVSRLGDRTLVTLVVVGTREDGSVQRFRNIRLFSRSDNRWLLEFWYNYEIPGR